MRILSWLLSLSLVLVVSAGAAETYSCRDSHGRLHLSDDKASLPEECFAKAQIHTSGEIDNFNLVPTPATEPGSRVRFEHEVREVERDIKQKQSLGEQLQQRAERLAAEYETAAADKRRATRRWSYGSREVIRQADRVIQETQQGKQQLLQELSGASLSQQDEQQVREHLDRIAE